MQKIKINNEKKLNFYLKNERCLQKFDIVNSNIN